jgi:uncharacterized repeat protein (TIGR01451 family)
MVLLVTLAMGRADAANRLLGIGSLYPLALPTMAYGNGQVDYDYNMVYDATLGMLYVQGFPTVFRPSVSIATIVGSSVSLGLGRSVEIWVDVGTNGVLVGTGTDYDLKVVGAVDFNGDSVMDFDGVLLTGKAVAFGFNETGGATDLYDFWFEVTGGMLQPLYVNGYVGVQVTSESSTFTGNFATDFIGKAKGTFGAAPCVGKVGNFVWHDLDQNGMQDAGEPGIPNVEISLVDQSWAVVGTQLTDANGYYTFSNLCAGTYLVVVDTNSLPSDLRALTIPNAPGSTVINDSNGPLDGGPAVVTLTPTNFVDLTIDFGYVNQPASLGDFVWYDTNQNGIQDNGESGMAYLQVTLSTCDGVMLTSTVTDVSGHYLFTHLTPGDYKVQFSLPGDYVFSQRFQGPDTDKDSNADQSSGSSDCITLFAGENNTSVDAGMYQPASLGDFVWNDTNHDGIQNSGEPGIAFVPVALYTCAGVMVTSTVTDASGYYLFPGLTPGDYSVQFSLPAGYAFSKAFQGANTAKDSNADETGLSDCVTIHSGDNNTTVDAGMYQPASLGDFVWNDANHDGIQDTNEAGINNVLVTLYTCAGTMVTSSVTDASGHYLFSDLTAGSYKVQFTLPSGFVFTKAFQGGDTAKDSNADQTTGISDCVTLNPGDNTTTVDAGMYQPASLGDFVWNDANHDGIQDANEAGINNVLVTLYTCAGTMVTSSVTDASGHYLFSDLAAGSYQVNFALPSGFVFSKAFQGGDTAKDSDADQSTGLSDCVTLNAGDNNTTVDAGLYIPSSIDIEKYVKVIPNECGGEGLTPGFWKTHSVYGPAPLAGWPATGYSPTASYETLFNVTLADTPSLLDALGTNGGGLSALLRHSAAALLNAANPNVSYLYSVAQVLSMTKAAIDSGNATTIESTKNLFVTQNELGADLTPGQSQGVGGGVPGLGDDADTPPGLIVPVASTVMYTYVVTNPTPLEIANVTITDDNGTPGAPGDDFRPTPVLSGAFNIGDLDQDNRLDQGEKWLYTHTRTNIAEGPLCNIAVVVGQPMVGSTPVGDLVTDNDPACITGQLDTADLGDFVWYDTNRNGIQDSGEAGIVNVQVTLYTCAGVVVTSTVTDANGAYLFSNLAPGDYKVQFALLQGFLFSPQGQGTTATDSNPSPTNGMTACVTLSAGQFDQTVDAGMYVKPCTGIIGDLVWDDCNANGVQDLGEDGLRNVVVNLRNGANNALIDSVLTDSSGRYQFVGLCAGLYSVEVVAPTGYVATTSGVGSDRAKDSNGNPAQVTLLTDSSANLTIDFGFRGGRPSVSLEKTGPTNAIPGTTITYHFKVVNTGNTCLYGGLSVYDPLVKSTGAIWHKTPVSPGETNEFDYSYCVPSTCSSQLVNVATAVGCPPVGSQVTATSKWSTTISQLPSSIKLVKTGPTNATNGKTITYQFKVINNGKTTLTNVKLKDPMFGCTTLFYDATMAPGETNVFEKTYCIPSCSPSIVTNTATVSACAPCGTLNTTSIWKVAILPLPSSIDLVKTGPTNATVGTTITYRFKVINTGKTTLTSVKVTDPMFGSTAIFSDSSMLPGETNTFSKTYCIPSGCPTILTNTAKVAAYTPSYSTITDSSTWKIPVAKKGSVIGRCGWHNSTAEWSNDRDGSPARNVRAELRRCSDNGLVATTRTDSCGRYSFTGVAENDYYVKFEMPQGCRFGVTDADDADGNGRTQNFRIGSSQTRLKWNAHIFAE